MGRRGPARTPTETLKIRGSWLAKVREKTEPKIQPGRMIPPAWLSKPAKAVWKKTLEVTPPGMITPADYVLLEMFCDAVAEWEALARAIEPLKQLQKSLSGGLTLHPLSILKNRANANVRALAAKLGLSPADRSSVQLVAALAADAEQDEFLRPKGKYLA